MRKIVFALLFLFATFKVSAQITFLGFDQPFCGSPLSLTYTYASYSTGGGSSALHGYKIYRNGIEVFYFPGGSMSLSTSCIDLMFINDSTGFLVEYIGGMGTRVKKTSDYGVSWISIGTSSPGYKALYIINANFVYEVTSISSYVFVARCSDVVAPQPYFINDDSVNTDVYKVDTVFNNSLCNIDSLNIFFTNSLGDTIDYHINLFYIPVAIGIDDLTPAKNKYSVYPNPAKNQIIVEGNSISQIEIYSIDGQKIATSFSSILDIESLSNGVYFLRILDSSGNIGNSKFIKQ